VKREIARIAVQLELVGQEIDSMLEDPGVELSRVIRKKAEQSELTAYLDGLRFSVTPDQP
jgi:hypothetical protein